MASACPAPEPIRIRDVDDVRALFATLAAGTVERCGFAYLDPEWMLLGVRETAAGTAHGAGVPLRAVIGDALALGAEAVVMVHNHPDGTLSPSTADIAVTRRLIAGLAAIDVRLVDHVVLGRGGHVSLRELNLL